MNQLIAAAVPLVLMAVFFVMPVLIISWLRKHYRRNRRSPLTAKLLRGPGQTLRQELYKVEDDISTYMALLVMAPFAFYSIHISQSHFGGAPESAFRWFLAGVTVLAMVIFVSWKLHKLSRTRFNLQCGLEAEIAMGEEHAQLMRSGAVVFHDFPAEQFNIDHVVLTRGGLYAVETKGRMKPDTGRGRRDASVEYDGTALLFPDWRDQKTLEQAKRQATWLAKWITHAVGETISVKPVVALPGWFVTLTQRGDVMVISGKQAPTLLQGWQVAQLTDQLMTRIAHQLEQRCRDVEPTRYGKQKRFGRNARQVA